MGQNSVQMVDRDGVRALLAEGAQLVKVLSKEEYKKIHLAGAFSLPLDQLDRERAARLRQDRPVIVYCADYQ